MLYLMLPASHSEAVGEPHRPCIPMSNQLPISLAHQTAVLLLLAVPVACASWTVTHEEVFREPREYCKRKSEHARALPQRKFFYLFTCEYCFSHYISAIFMFLAGYHLLFTDWRGYLIAFFSLVFVANAYLNLYNRLRIDITAQKVETKVKEKEMEKIDRNNDPGPKDFAAGGDGAHSGRLAATKEVSS
ncbi:MAG TPA: hypothetical protein VFE47_17795 [Tepidisphaeraceae bacterium]|nr:hypothetical protein [Tepidisphaeraceae bacterium]